MSVYVDPIRDVFQFEADYRTGFRHPQSCHMSADSNKELEEMAEVLKLRKAWRHGDHYDLTPHKRAAAVKSGAIEITRRQMVELRKAKR